MSISSEIPTRDPCQTTLSPLDVIALEAALEPFCPVADAGGVYHPDLCLPFCSICADLLILED